MSGTEVREPEAGDVSRRDYVIEILFMLLAMVPVLVSAYASHITGDGQWFQRSGALMVLFSVAVEYHRRRMPRSGSNEVVGPKSIGRAGTQIVQRFWGSIPYVCYISVFIGTLIWSYGDLLF